MSSHSMKDGDGKPLSKVPSHRLARHATLEATHQATLSMHSSKWDRVGSGKLLHPPNYDPEHEAIDLKETALAAKIVPFFRLFRYSTTCDYIIMTVGIAFALISGCLLIVLVYTTHAKKYVYTLLGLNCSICFLCTTFIFHSCFMNAANRQLTRIRLAYMESIMRKDFAFIDNFIDRDLALRVTNDITDISYGIGENIPKLVMYTEAALGMLVLAFVAHAELTFVTVLCVPLLSVIAYIRLKAAERLTSKEQDAYGKADAVAAEILSCIKIVKVFQGEAKELERYSQALFSPKVLWKTVLITAGACGLMWFLPTGLHATLFYIFLEYFEEPKAPQDPCEDHSNLNFLKGLHAGRYSGLYLNFLCVLFASTYCALGPVIIEKVRTAQRVAAEVFFAIDWKSRIDNLSEAGEMPRRQAIGKLELIHVSFRYPRSAKVYALNDVSLKIYPGQMVCLFGPTNCGKTAVTMLLARIYDACSGKVKLDGMDIERLNVSWVRSQFGIIAQNQQLFSTTIEENVRYGKLDASYDDVVKYCKITGVHNDIMSLTEGYNTIVGLRSSTRLTDMQQKRISLARLLLQKPKIMILDNYVADIDEEFEEFLLNLLEGYREKVSTIILTSDKVNSLVKNSDVIFAMKNGKVVEVGNHEDLFEKNGIYFDTIHANLEEKFGQKPIFTSQLTCYKFAAAIKRKHKLHDAASNVNFDEYFRDKSILKSTLLRHTDPNYDHRRVQPRIMGGFHRYQVYTSVRPNTHYFDKLVRSTLLRERDLRRKLMEPKHFVPESVSSPEFEVSPNDTALLGNKVTSVNKVPSWHKSVLNAMKVSSNPRSNEEGGGGSGGSRGSGGEGGPHGVKSSIGFLKELDNKPSLTDEKLQHYLGWMINSSPDNESISSDDSCAFWDVYNRTLQLALRIKLDPKTFTSFIEYLKLMRFSWPYLLVASVTASLIGMCMCGIIYEEAELFPAYTAYLYSKSSRNVTVLGDTEIRPYNERATKFYTVCSYMVLFSFVAAVSAVVQEVVLSFGIFRSNNAMRREVFSHILEQDLEWFDYPENDIGGLCDCLATQTASVQVTFAATCTQSFQSLAIISFVLFSFFSRHVNEGEFDEELRFLIPVIPLTIFVGYFEESMLGRFNSMIAAALEEPSKIQCNVITNIREVIILNLQDHFIKIYSKSILEKRKQIFFYCIMRPMGFALSKSAYFILFHVWLTLEEHELGGKTLEEPQYTSERVATFYLIAQLFITGLLQVGAALATLPHSSESLAAADMILSVERHRRIAAENRKLREKEWTLANEAPLHHKSSFKTNFEEPPPDIHMVNVRFAYPVTPDAFLLKNISIKIESHKFVAIVGPVKSGKSAIVGLLLKLYFATSGSLKMNSKDYVEISDKDVLRIVSLVEQDPTFLNLTLGENIAYGDNSREVSMKEIEDAAKLARIHDIIEDLEFKYDTQISDLPESHATFVLRQRLAVARVVIKNPKVLIVDEATTSVDVKNFDLLNEALEELRTGRTTIVTSQRIEPIRKADTIIVLKNGQVAEIGTDSELLARKGTYYEIFMAQKLFEVSKTIRNHKRSYHSFAGYNNRHSKSASQ